MDKRDPPAMTRINSGHFFQAHFDGKRREIKPGTAWPFG